EMALSEIREMIRVLATAPKLLAGVKLPGPPGMDRREAELYKQHGVKPDTSPAKHRTLANRNVTTLTRNWLAEFRKMDEGIKIKDVVAYLKDNGVTGKERSLYSAVHVILKKEVKARGSGGGGSGLHYKSGVGFFKSREKVDDLTHRDTELVAR